MVPINFFILSQIFTFGTYEEVLNKISEIEDHRNVKFICRWTSKEVGSEGNFFIKLLFVIIIIFVLHPFYPC